MALNKNFNRNVFSVSRYYLNRLPYTWKVALCIVLLPFLGLPIGIIVFTFIAVRDYAKATGDCWRQQLRSAKNEKPVPPEPAFKSYFYKRARQDVWDIIYTAFNRSYAAVGRFETDIERRSDENFRAIAVVGSTLTVTVFFICITVVYAVIIPSHHLIVYLLYFFTLLVAPLIRLSEWVARKYRSISYECPRCSRKISLLLYQCPNKECLKIHRNLVPNSYGLIRRKCECHQLLPAFDLVGRSKLNKKCPYCDYPIMGDDATIYHLAFAGGVSSGKTSLMIAAISAYIEQARHNGLEISFPYKEDELKYSRWKIDFERGKQPEKTQGIPMAIILCITEKNGNKHNIYFYDAAGEVYSREEEGLATSVFLNLADGIIFVIDPFSIPQIRAHSDPQIVSAARPSTDDPDHILQRLLDYMEIHKIKALSWRKIPVLIVVNKADALQQTNINDSNLKEWITSNGMAGFDARLHNNFDYINYFLVSALGSNAGQKTAFKPVNVLSPLADLLDKSNIKAKNQLNLKSRLKSQRIGTALGLLTSSVVFLAAVIAVVMIIRQIVLLAS
jgi:hypothetical protein